MIENQMLTVKEVAGRLRVCERTVYTYLKQGLLKPVRLGGTKKTGRNLIPAQQVEDLLKPLEVKDGGASTTQG